MIMPVRCFSCGKVLGGVYEEFKERTQKGEDAGVTFIGPGPDAMRIMGSKLAAKECVKKYKILVDGPNLFYHNLIAADYLNFISGLAICSSTSADSCSLPCSNA